MPVGHQTLRILFVRISTRRPEWSWRSGIGVSIDEHMRGLSDNLAVMNTHAIRFIVNILKLDARCTHLQVCSKRNERPLPVFMLRCSDSLV